MSVLLVEPAIDENSIETSNIDPSTVVSKLAKTKEIIGEKVAEVVGNGVVPDYKYHKSSGGATVYDENGNNLVNNKVYGDIAMAGDKLFMVGDINDGVEVFSIPEKKLVEVTKEVEKEETFSEKVVPTTEVNTEVSTEVATTLENSTEVVTALENSTEVTDLANIFGDNKEETTNISFEDITAETPTADINNEATTEIATDYLRDEEVQKSIESMKEKNENVVDMTSFLRQFEKPAEEEKVDNYQSDPFADYKGIHVDDIEYDKDLKDEALEVVPNNGDFEDAYNGRDELEIVPDETAKEIVKAFEDLGQENANKDRLLADKDHELAEKDREIEKLKYAGEKKDNQIGILEQRYETAISAIRELRSALTKETAEKESAENKADIYIEKANGFKLKLAEQDRVIAKLSSQLEAYRYLKDQWERIKTAQSIGSSYDDVDSYMKY